MKVTVFLCAFGAVAITMLSLGVASHSREVRGQAKELVAVIESKIFGYEPLY